MLADTITLVDNSTGTPANLNLVQIASPSLPNNQKLRRLSVTATDEWLLTMTFAQNAKSGIVAATYATQRKVASAGISEYVAFTTKVTYPGEPAVLTKAQLLSVMSAHGSFIDTASSLVDADNCVRFFWGREL